MGKPTGRTVAETAVEMVEVALPNDANPLGNLLGGKVMHLIDIAGAIVASDTLARARALGLFAHESLAANDGHGFFQALGDSVITGPTLTNVNDFRAILIEVDRPGVCPERTKKAQTRTI